MTKETINLQAWTTENEDAVVWGTHDIETAKKVYAELQMDTDPDWDDVRFYWGRPGLDEQETWAPDDTAEAPGDGIWVPFLIFGF